MSFRLCQFAYYVDLPNAILPTTTFRLKKKLKKQLIEPNLTLQGYLT